MINNLIINATQAMPEGGVISIEAVNLNADQSPRPGLEPGNYLHITVTDQGHGIPEKVKDKIFDPFFTTKDKGSGLGLASSYSIIKNHNGHIGIAETSSQGTVFDIYLPATEKRAAVATGAQVSRLHRGAGRILLLDDEELICQATSQILKHLGYETDSFNEGEAAVAAFAQARNGGRPYDLLIFDLTIPGGMGGIETLKRILELDPKARAVVSSGYANDPVMAFFQDYGFIDRIAKPYSVSRISEVLDRCLSIST